MTAGRAHIFIQYDRLCHVVLGNGHKKKGLEVFECSVVVDIGDSHCFVRSVQYSMSDNNHVQLSKQTN